MIFGYFKVSLENKYLEGHYWGNVVLKLLEGVTSNESIFIDGMCTMYLYFFFHPFKELAIRELKLYQRCKAIGNYEL